MDIIFQIGATEKLTGGSDAYVHRVREVFNVKGNDKEVASVRLPVGSWVVSAKAVVLANWGSQNFTQAAALQNVVCRLTASSMDRLGVADSANDRSTNSVTPSPAASAREGFNNEVSHYETISLLLGVEFKSGGFVVMSADSPENVSFSDIVISAIRVNSLTIESI